MPFQAKREQLARRQKMMDILSQRAITPQQTQMVSGRAVPQGFMSQLGPVLQAMMAKEGGADIAKRRGELDTQESQAIQGAMRGAMDQYTGVPETKYQLSPEERFGEGDISSITATPEIKADPTGAAMRVATDPYLSQSKPAQAMMQQLMKQRGASDRGGYSTMTPGTEGALVFNTRTQKMEYKPYPKGFGGPIKQDVGRTTALATGKAKGKEIGADTGKAIVDLPASEVRTEQTLDLVDELVDHPGMKDVIGVPDNPLALKGLVPGTQAADFRSRLDQLKGRTFMEIFPTLKGGGQITEVEGQKGQDSINRMSAATTEVGFVKAANDFKDEVKRLREVTLKRAGITPKIKEEVLDKPFDDAKERRYQEWKAKQ